MGLFCVNFHCRTTDDAAVTAALNRRSVRRHRVIPAEGAWTSFVEQQASAQDETRIRALAGGLSEDLNTATIALMVHDSDIACYWLYDRGELIDEYNSCPGYFSDSAYDDGPSGGRAELLQPYCRAGTTADDLTAMLAGEATFADDVIGKLAEVLGIEPLRALVDYRDIERGDWPDDLAGFGGDDDGDEGDEGGAAGDGPNLLPFSSGLAGQLMRQLGGGQPTASADPQAVALVQAAAAGDIVQIERLLGEGAPIDAEAPAPLPQGQPTAGLGKLLPGGLPQFPMTPLLTAVIHQQVRAAQRLLAGGSDPNRVHPLFGTPLHAATGAGNVELLRLLLDSGGNINVHNSQGQTPLAIVASSRAAIDRLAQAKAAIQSLGMKLPGILDGLSESSLPTAGWDACESLLRSRGGM